jgi:carbon starvation protein
LDTCTRLTRFLIEELFNWRNAQSRYLGTLLVLIIPAIAAFLTFKGPDGTALPAWKAIWPLFGATNQLLAALALITFVVFLKHRQVAFGFALLPTAVMLIMPLSALMIMVVQYGPVSLLGGISLGMALLGVYMAVASLKHTCTKGI